MSVTVSARPNAPAQLSEIAVVFAFAATLFLSAFLLFSVEPMFARLILPRLGGSPSVWAVALCFFQGALLAGYLYAHAINRYLSGRQALLVHLALLACVAFALPIAIPAWFGEPPADGVYLWLMELLAAGVGLPFFAVSANGPLLQAWFSRTGGRRAADPYFLYGASNLGSLIALVAYPLAIEPSLGLHAQSTFWSLGFAALTPLIALCGFSQLRAPAHFQPALEVSTKLSPADAAPTWAKRGLWVSLALLPSGLVVAVTTYITTDIASAPFIWVVPLALFLITFILVFREKLAFSYQLVCELLPAAVLGVILLHDKIIACLFALAAFFLAALVCHRELYQRRPGVEHLTEFYLWLSVGGVLGGIFSALLAPHIFTSVFEFPLLALLALLCRPGVLLGRTESLRWSRLALIGVAMIGLIGGCKLAVHLRLISASPYYLFGLALVCLVGLALIRKWPEHRPALVLAMIVGAAMSPNDLRTIAIERSFFGTHRVLWSEDGATRLLLNGTTIHGARRLFDTAGRPIVDPIPATYYESYSPLARAVAIAREALAARGKPLEVGVIGLGAGSLACYSRPGEAWRYFEIDPVVVRLATDPKYFDFLSHCLPHADIVLGDARLTLARQPLGGFGLLVIDAFSSDVVPVHLLTAEALRMYVERLDPDGLIALHISNRNLDLAPAVASTLALLPDLTGAIVSDPRPANGFDFTPSQVVFIARNPAILNAVLREPGAHALAGGSVRPWTDDYADVLGAFLRRL